MTPTETAPAAKATVRPTLTGIHHIGIEREARHGVTMHRANDEGYSRPGTWLIDDWR
jgi:hypothetical protein